MGRRQVRGKPDAGGGFEQDLSFHQTALLLKGQTMRALKGVIFFLLAVSLPLSLVSLSAKGALAAGDTGESLFKANCSACHPDGDNILNRKKTLHKADREANNIFTAENIINKMRNPGPAPTHPQEWAGMKMFDKDKISDEDALKIANYILETFN
jgi:mono/diheme cytochrome c family protein